SCAGRTTGSASSPRSRGSTPSPIPRPPRSASQRPSAPPSVEVRVFPVVVEDVAVDALVELLHVALQHVPVTGQVVAPPGRRRRPVVAPVLLLLLRLGLLRLAGAAGGEGASQEGRGEDVSEDLAVHEGRDSVPRSPIPGRTL